MRFPSKFQSNSLLSSKEHVTFVLAATKNTISRKGNNLATILDYAGPLPISAAQ